MIYSFYKQIKSALLVTIMMGAQALIAMNNNGHHQLQPFTPPIDNTMPLAPMLPTANLLPAIIQLPDPESDEFKSLSLEDQNALYDKILEQQKIDIARLI